MYTRSRCPQRYYRGYHASLDEEKIKSVKQSALGIDSPSDNIAIKKREIRARQIKRQKESIQKTIHTLEKRLRYAEEEALFFVEAFKSLEKKGKIKPFDDLESQKEYWNERFKQKFRLGSLLGFRPDVDLVETILNLNDDAPVKKEIVTMIGEIQNRAIAQLSERPQKIPTPLPEEPLTISIMEKERNAN